MNNQKSSNNDFLTTEEEVIKDSLYCISLVSGFLFGRDVNILMLGEDHSKQTEFKFFDVKKKYFLDDLRVTARRKNKKITCIFEATRYSFKVEKIKSEFRHKLLALPTNIFTHFCEHGRNSFFGCNIMDYRIKFFVDSFLSAIRVDNSVEDILLHELGERRQNILLKILEISAFDGTQRSEYEHFKSKYGIDKKKYMRMLFFSDFLSLEQYERLTNEKGLFHSTDLMRVYVDMLLQGLPKNDQASYNLFNYWVSCALEHHSKIGNTRSLKPLVADFIESHSADYGSRNIDQIVEHVISKYQSVGRFDENQYYIALTKESFYALLKFWLIDAPLVEIVALMFLSNSGAKNFVIVAGGDHILFMYDLLTEGSSVDTVNSAIFENVSNFKTIDSLKRKFLNNL